MSSEVIGQSDAQPVIDARGVSKDYRVYASPGDRFKQAFAWGKRQYFKEFKALDDVSLSVMPGEMVGIIGRNGSGKSTLLQIIAGTLAPTRGEVSVRGRVAALLELGSGFDLDASGVENIYINGSVLGLSNEEIRDKYDEIVAFADIGEFVHQPVRTYSSGMIVRLAFAVSAHVDARVLIIDEALAVGDVAFQAKCFRRIKRLREDGVTILLATHDNQTVSTYCDHAILMENGCVAARGSGKDVSQEYYRRVREIERLEASAAEADDQPETGEISAPEEQDNSTDLLKQETAKSSSRMGDGRAEIVKVALYDTTGEPISALPVRETARFELTFIFHEDLEDPHVGICLRDVQGRIMIGGHTLYEQKQLGPVRAGQRMRVLFEWAMLVNPGKYLLMFGVAEHDGPTGWQDCDIYFDHCEIEVYGTAKAWGIVNVPVAISVYPEEVG